MNLILQLQKLYSPTQKTMQKNYTFLLITIFICLASSLEANPSKPSQFSKLTRSPHATTPSFTSLCKPTPYPSACESTLLSLKVTNVALLPKTRNQLFDHSIQFTVAQVHSGLDHISWVRTQASHQTRSSGAINDCIELLDDTLDQLSNVENRRTDPTHTHSDVQTWLSTSLTNQETCQESLLQENSKLLEGGERLLLMNFMAKNLSQHISNSLALHLLNYKNTPNGRKLLNHDNNSNNNNKFPSWVSSKERKLLEASMEEIKAHAVVAKDGSGTHESIGEAILHGVRTSLAAGGGGRSVIYVKAGTYHETISVPTKQHNVMLVGDGKGKTVIVGSKNAVDGSTTYNSATVGVMGDGFIAKDITFVNSAGPSKQQAVALRVGSDRAVIFQCSIVGYQDSLYTLSKRQFYRDTDIHGTIDFIFGNAAVVFQNCDIYSRNPGSSGLQNYITAQGRTDPNQNTGISVHNCRIASESGVGSKITYLGRPWKLYSRTVFMQSTMDGSIHPAGWYPWTGGSNPKSLYYGEYMNSGPGASTSGRVKWPGYHSSLASIEAQEFTVGTLIAGNSWLPSTGVTFDSGLL